MARFETVLWVVGTIVVLQTAKHLFGYGPALVVAVAALAFCIGALWGAGGVNPKDPTS